MKPKLRCRPAQLRKLAQRYEYESDGIDLLALKDGIVVRGWMTKAELRTVSRWKAPRSAGYMEKNSEEYVKEVTAIALTSTVERTRVEALTLLDGVQWPTASVILHFYHKDPYPIIDFRTLWSITMEVPTHYSFEFWWQYVEYCRLLAKRAHLEMRALDQALWQYSKENQVPV